MKKTSTSAAEVGLDGIVLAENQFLRSILQSTTKQDANMLKIHKDGNPEKNIYLSHIPQITAEEFGNMV